MSRSIICYAQPEKKKSQLVLEAFARGCSGKMASTQAEELEPGDCAFYGVRPAWARLWEQAKREGRDWYYIDNAYFDRAREVFFRITLNGLQCDGMKRGTDGKVRLERLGITVKDWRKDGAHILICPQSDEFTALGGQFPGDWSTHVVKKLSCHTDRELRVRKKGENRPLREDLRGAWALATHMSCAAVEALLEGIPVFCTGLCAASIMGESDLSRIEAPRFPEGRTEWAEALAENQWTLDEMRRGDAWLALCTAASTR